MLSLVTLAKKFQVTLGESLARKLQVNLVLSLVTLGKVTSNPCLVIKTPKQSDKYICPTPSYRELQQKLRKAFQNKIETMSKIKRLVCIHANFHIV